MDDSSGNCRSAARGRAALRGASRYTEYMETFSATTGGERLDAALAQRLGVSRARVQRLIEAGGVTVNGRPVKASHRLRAGEVVAYEPAPPPPPPSALTPAAMALDIVHEDGALIVLNKPPGLVVHPGAGHREATLVHGLLHHARTLSALGGLERPGIVHRLDKDTSGLLVVAKTDAAHERLARQFREGRVNKLYQALVLGEPAEASGRIEAPIGRHPVERQRMAVRMGGRRALTEWRVLERFGCCALVEFILHTGRTHQIRVHAASLGHPVAGDATYGGRRYGSLPGSAACRRAVAASPRQMLHAKHLGFSHPVSGEPLQFEAPLAEDFAAVLMALREALRP